MDNARAQVNGLLHLGIAISYCVSLLAPHLLRGPSSILILGVFSFQLESIFIILVFIPILLLQRRQRGWESAVVQEGVHQSATVVAGRRVND